MTDGAAEPEEERTLFRRAASAVPQPADPLLHVLDLEATDGEPPRRVPLGPSPLVIGRTEQNGLVLPSPDVSRQHCVVALEDGAAIVTDLGSTNGTVVDGRPAEGPVRLAPGARLRLGPFTLVYRAGRASDLARAEAQERDLARAGRYVEALLPAPIEDGPVRAAWRFLPSARIGGDGFGYGWIGEGRFAAWLLDVSGHGAGSALLAASAMNMLRDHALPGVDFAEPAAVLRAANERFQMDRHGGLYFSIWYGVVDLARRVVAYGCAGQHPAFLIAQGASAPTPLWVRSPAIGLAPDIPYRAVEAALPPAARLCLFSDGAFEIATPDGRQLGLGDFLPDLSAEPEPGIPEPERLLRLVRGRARPGPLDDDVSILTLDIP